MICQESYSSTNLHFNEDIQLHMPLPLTIDVYIKNKKKKSHDIYFHDNKSGYFHFINNEVSLASSKSIDKLTNYFFTSSHLAPHLLTEGIQNKTRPSAFFFFFLFFSFFGREKVKVQQNATPTPPDMPKELCCLEF